MKKNVVIVVLGLLVLGLGGYLVYDKILNKEDSKENKSETENILEKVETKEYKHFTEEQIIVSTKAMAGFDYIIYLKIEDKKLNEKSHDLTINGIKGNVKYFTYDRDCTQEIAILALTEEGNVYVAYIDPWIEGGIKSIDFEQVETKEKIVDVTLHPFIGRRTCLTADLAVVLENGEIRSVDINEQPNSMTFDIGTEDYSKYETTVGSIVLFNDHTIALEDCENNGFPLEKNKIKYKNELLKVNKIYREEKTDAYYVVSEDDKLYKLEIESDNCYEKQTSLISINLVNEKTVKAVSTKKVREEIYLVEKETITFTDGTKIELKDLNQVYISE